MYIYSNNINTNWTNILKLENCKFDTTKDFNKIEIFDKDNKLIDGDTCVMEI
jgi:hypothetical protein